jgi:hypothetical protein
MQSFETGGYPGTEKRTLRTSIALVLVALGLSGCASMETHHRPVPPEVMAHRLQAINNMAQFLAQGENTQPPVTPYNPAWQPPPVWNPMQGYQVIQPTPVYQPVQPIIYQPYYGW